MIWCMLFVEREKYLREKRRDRGRRNSVEFLRERGGKKMIFDRREVFALEIKFVFNFIV